jgi:hypothetical protein
MNCPYVNSMVTTKEVRKSYFVKHVKKPVQMLVWTGYCYSHLKTYEITNWEVKSLDRSHG